MIMRKSTAIVACVALAAAGATSIASGQGPDPEHGDPERVDMISAEKKRTAAVRDVPADVARRFKLFREQKPGAMSNRLKERVASPDKFGRSASLAREIETPYGPGWVIPGDGFLCLAVPTPVGTEGVTCMPAALAAKRGLWLRLSSIQGTDKALDTVVVPDGTRAVRVGSQRLEPSDTGIVSAFVAPSGDPELER